ncbi:hypothetical protein OUZ56_006763 [Daphnia magna]|uniref:Protein kinase domain-containing protein n=1 Tax=Daphnia magna TaxID=35525 RepID=A0ABQ9YWL2_9CRUS|nr:hypothetical protein OUZ56_006763 [Daphnia magna]
MELDEKVLLGKGAEGHVFLGTFAGEKVAIKRVLTNADTVVDPARQRREDETMKKLEHPNVLKLIEVVEKQNFRYLILEFCVGTIRDYIRKKYTGPMPSEIEGMIQMASGLQYIHSQNFVHRDIKPENVLISSSHVLKISDFGICRPVTTSSQSFSLSSVPTGTRMFNSPELLQSEEKSPEEKQQIKAYVSTDIFSLGCLFFSYITMGGHPFAKEKIIIEFVTVANIFKGKKYLGKDGCELGLSKDHYAFSMIDGMTEVNPTSRWTLDRVLKTLENQKLKLAQDEDNKH